MQCAEAARGGLQRPEGAGPGTQDCLEKAVTSTEGTASPGPAHRSASRVQSKRKTGSRGTVPVGFPCPPRGVSTLVLLHLS